jgi:hypothetical protein
MVAEQRLTTVETWDDAGFIAACRGGHFTVWHPGKKVERYDSFLVAVARANRHPRALVYAVTPEPERLSILLVRSRWPHYCKLQNNS